MLVSELNFEYPEALIATRPVYPPRVMVVENDQPREILFSQLLELFQSGDILVRNNTRVLKRRVFASAAHNNFKEVKEDLEILFLSEKEDGLWEVLFKSSHLKLGQEIHLPGDVRLELVKKGRPQLVRLSSKINEEYFKNFGEIPLPPYIQKARQKRHNLKEDLDWYQTCFSKKPGSFAAPTASLHFKENDFQKLKDKNIKILEVTLHVGLGTFLPVTSENLNDHKMHSEFVEIAGNEWSEILRAKSEGRNIWALGTTVCRSLESVANGLLPQNLNGDYVGWTDLMIKPSYEFKIVDRLLTNFHQPESTLLALVAAFSQLKTVKECYRWAIERDFRLFSYGDFSAWIKK